MTINNVLSILLLTKNRIFKHISSRILFFIIVLAIFSSFNDPFTDYHNQQFELFYEDESVIIWHSRSLDITDDFGLKHAISQYRIWEHKEKYKNKAIRDSLFNQKFGKILDRY